MSHWSREEVEAIVSDYFDMLTMELRGQSFNKAEHNRNIQSSLNDRGKGSVEFKHQNISAVLIECGYPYIKGYKARYNYQKSILPDVVLQKLIDNPDLHKLVEAVVRETVEKPPAVTDLLSILVPAPRSDGEKAVLKENFEPKIRRPVQRNFLEIESRNRSLGLAGENLVLEYEHQRLWSAGKKNLANRIDHVSKTLGDGLGYDILSFETDGRERLIEVKTTRFGESTPFFATKNEVEFSEIKEAEYQLYRLYNFTNEPKLFSLRGSLRSTCSLSATQFAASPR